MGFTLVPNVGVLRFFDLPGFNDTDGSERNLVNAAFIRQILLDATSVRLVFVVGEDEITAEKGTIAKKMFAAIKRLLAHNQGINFCDNGILVATKVFCAHQADVVPYLLRKTNSPDKEEIHRELESWGRLGKISHLSRPTAQADIYPVSTRERILGLVQGISPVRITNIDVSVLYPMDTQSRLEELFFNIMERVFNRQLETTLVTLSDYDRAASIYSAETFWNTFAHDLCHEEGEIGLIKELASVPYHMAIENMERTHEERRQTYLRELADRRQQRVAYIERKTREVSQAAILSVAESFLTPGQSVDDCSPIIFANYQKEFKACAGFGLSFSEDPAEKHLASQQYGVFIEDRNAALMDRWNQRTNSQRFEEIERLNGKLELMGRELQRVGTEAQTREEQNQRNVTQLIARLEASERARTEDIARVQAEAQAREEQSQRSIAQLIARFEASEATRIQALQGLREEALAPAQSARIADGAITTAKLDGLIERRLLDLEEGNVWSRNEFAKLRRGLSRHTQGIIQGLDPSMTPVGGLYRDGYRWGE